MDLNYKILIMESELKKLDSKIDLLEYEIDLLKNEKENTKQCTVECLDQDDYFRRIGIM